MTTNVMLSNFRIFFSEPGWWIGSDSDEAHVNGSYAASNSCSVSVQDFGMCVHEAIRFNHFDGRIQLFSEAPPLRRILQSVVGG